MEGILMDGTPMTEREAMLLNPLQLAYIGDAVWDLLVRTDLMRTGNNVHAMHKMASGRVSAVAQAGMVKAVLAKLLPAEQEMIKRGRNARAKHPIPKNQDAADYGCATGLEALIGFLYLTGCHGRIKALYHLLTGEDNHAGENA